MRILQDLTCNNPTIIRYHHFPLSFTLFNSPSSARTIIQTRWKKKPANTAQTRLHARTRDPKLDPLTAHFVRLSRILNLHRLVSARKRGPFVSLQLLSRWAPHVGLDTIPVGAFLRKYPHVFDVFTHPILRNVCFKFRQEFVELLKEENDVIRGLEFESVMRIKKILMMSVNGSIHLHALRLARKELGLPEDFRESIIQKYDHVFRMVNLEVVELVRGISYNSGPDDSDENERFIGVAEVEKWREKEYREKWLSEFEVKYAFPMNFPTGFKKEAGFKDKLRNWQRLNYVKPYEKKEVVRVRTCGGVERYEKRAVAIIHELLCLTVEKMVDVQHLVHFRKDLGIEVNLRELVLKHPGIFYMSTKGDTQMVFLREAYSKGCLVEPNPIYDVRRKMLDLILLGPRCTRRLRTEWEVSNQGQDVICTESRRKVSDEEQDISCIERQGEAKDGDFVIPILEDFADCSHQNGHQ
ncbi:protein ROOT PRIMORDIUM DEFECTIVE 1 [Coffea eugenioides]|uniref:protein ROOT PRIMORDIUM DEFECTIVE 1 n=1 Tax=Coffea eugenioides TaxID=49369 RepID=UPI000F608594|nr:protein ROOT PRIMORDIUM DEFECTIVE 1 [Coffea eugenioides]XP_027170763.1 protein ROOT PRIMORDIUM DEFECTIVE 1 [Coffea eugenioides]